MINELYDLEYYKNIYHLILEQPINKETTYLAVLDKINDKIVERIYAYRWEKNGLEYKEVQRRVEGSKFCLVRDMYLPAMNTYKTFWESDKKKNHFWYSYNMPNSNWEMQDIKHFQVKRIKLYDINTLTKLDETLKYCYYDDKIDITTYITKYREYPEIELISKLGLSSYILNERFLKTIKKDKEFRRFIINNVEDIKKFPATITTILNAYKNKREILNQKEIEYCKRTLRSTSIKDLFIDKEFKLFKYLEEQNKYLMFYIDYVNACLQYVSREDFCNDTKYLFPYNLTERHDFYVELVNEEKRKINEEKSLEMEKLTADYLFLEYKNEKYKIILARNQNELIEEGKELNHCVGINNYLDKILQNKSLILFLRELNNNNSFYTIEYNHHKNEIIQCRGENNIPESEEIKETIREWVERNGKNKIRVKR